MKTWFFVGIVLFLIFLIYSSNCECRRGFSIGGVTDSPPPSVYCDPTSTVIQFCPDGSECPDCGMNKCLCPSPPPPPPSPSGGVCNNKEYWKGSCSDTKFTLVDPSKLDLKDKIYIYNNLDIQVTVIILRTGGVVTEQRSISSKKYVVFDFPYDANLGYRLNIQRGNKILSFVEFSNGGLNMSYVDSLSYPVRIHTCCNKKRGCCFENIKKYIEFNKNCCPFGPLNVDTTPEKTGCLSQSNFCLTKKTDPKWNTFCGSNSHLTSKEVGSVCDRRSNTASDIWGCNPEKGYSGHTGKPIGFKNAQCCAALNRGVSYLDAGPYDQNGNYTNVKKPSNKFYKRSDKKYNQYSKMIHTICPNDIFGFPHDDINADGGYLGWEECKGNTCGKRGGFAIQIG